MLDNFDFLFFLVDRAGILLRKSVKFFDLRTKLSNFGGSILRKKHVPWNFNTKLTEPYKANKDCFAYEVVV